MAPFDLPDLIRDALVEATSPSNRLTAALVALETASDALESGDHAAARMFLADALGLVRSAREAR